MRIFFYGNIDVQQNVRSLRRILRRVGQLGGISEQVIAEAEISPLRGAREQDDTVVCIVSDLIFLK